MKKRQIERWVSTFSSYKETAFRQKSIHSNAHTKVQVTASNLMTRILDDRKKITKDKAGKERIGLDCEEPFCYI